jgi:hypothetical protein
MSGRRRPGNGDSDEEDDQRMAMLRAAAVDGAEILGQIPPSLFSQLVAGYGRW